MMAVFDHDSKGYKVRIENLDIDTSRAELMTELDTFGVVRKCWLPNTSGGSAYAVFNSANGANNAVRKLDGRHLSGRRVRMEHVQPSPYQGKQSRKQDGPSDRDILPYHAIKSLLKPRSTFMIMSSTTSRSRSTSRKKYIRSRSESNHSRSRSRHYTSRSRTKVRSKTRSWSRSRSRARSNARSRRRHRRRWYKSSRKSHTRRRRKHHHRSSSRSTSRSNSESRSSSNSRSSSRSSSSSRSRSSSSSRRTFKSRVSKRQWHFGYCKCDDGGSCHGSSKHRSAENKVQGCIRSRKRESHYDDGGRSKNKNHDFEDTEMTAMMSVNSFHSVDDAQMTIPSNNANTTAVRDRIQVTFSCKKQMKRTVDTPVFNMHEEDTIPDVTEASTSSSSAQAAYAAAADRIISRGQSSTEMNRPKHLAGGIAAAPFHLPTSYADIGTTHSNGDNHFYDESTQHVRTVFAESELLNNVNIRGRSEHGNGVERNRIQSMSTSSTSNAYVMSMSKAAVQATTTSNGAILENSNVHSKGARPSNLPDNPPDNPPANTADNNVLIISVNEDSF